MNNKEVVIETYTGIRFSPLDPNPRDICITDIAHALSNMCRFNGHTQEFYSVAQHSVLVSLNVPDKFAKHGLLHDAAEAYLVDLPSPVKHNTEFGLMIKEVENRLTDVIFERFGIENTEPKEVKDIENRILATEYRDLMNGNDSYYTKLEPYSLMNIQGICPEVAREWFLARFKWLWR